MSKIKKAGVSTNLLLSPWKWVLIVVICHLSFMSVLEASTGCPTPNFAVTTPNANFSPSAVGDFNGDGKADLAGFGGVGGSRVMILLGNGDGTFQPGASYAIQGSFLGPIAVGDFNGDGKSDLAIGHSMPFGVAVVLGNGDGTFQPPMESLTDNTPHVHPIFAVQVGDFNGDGKADLALTDTRGLFGGVTVTLGRGDGTFQATAAYQLGATPYALAVGDFNGDGKADLAAADFQSENVSIFLSNGNGTFHNPVTYTVGSGPDSIVAGDFNGDGKLDLAVANTGSNNVSILLGNGDGTFQAPVNYLAGAGPNSTAVGDFNSDGVPDLAVTNSDSNTLSILLGHGDGTFQAAIRFPTVSAPSLVLAGDFTGDGRTDLVVAGGSLRPSSLMINTCSLSCPNIIIQPATLSDGMAGIAYNQSLGASGGVGTYRFTVSLGFLPPGLSFSSTGTLSGTPPLGGTFSFSVTAMDITGCTGVHDYSLSIRKSTGSSSAPLSMSGGGAFFTSTIGSTGLTQAGYAALNVDAGTVPYGTAVFSLTQNGAVVSEVGVPASPPTTTARIFIDYRRGIAAKSDALHTGTIDVNTGFAVVNLGSAASIVTYTLRDTNGETLAIGTGTLAPGAHRAKFIDQLSDLAPDFNLPAEFSSTTRFGSLELKSTNSQPLSVVALRLTSNQREETLITSTPIADETKPLVPDPLYFPHVVDGGGYKTTLILLNTSTTRETGTLRIFKNDGSPLTLAPVGGNPDSSFAYAIQPGGVYILQSEGSASSISVGSVQLTPDVGTWTPVGSGVFSFSQGGILVTESGIPSATPTSHARIFVDTLWKHDTGLAIANPNTPDVSITVQAFGLDGVTPMGTTLGPIALKGNGQTAAFVKQLITGLPEGFVGVLDVSTPSTLFGPGPPFVALTLRSLTNSRGDFLLTTFPVADANQQAPFPIVFPQIVDGGGYQSEFILLNTSGSPNRTTLNLFGDDGSPLAVGKKGK